MQFKMRYPAASKMKLSLLRRCTFDVDQSQCSCLMQHSDGRILFRLLNC